MNFFRFSSFLLVVLLFSSSIPEFSADDSIDNEIIPKNSKKAILPDDRGRLINVLFADYDKRNYPTNNTLDFGVSLTRFDVDDYKKNVIDADIWLKMTWYDPRLQWDPSDFGGETMFRFPSDEVWKPDMSLYNTAEPHDSLRCRETNVLIYNDGKILWVPSCYIQANCNLTLDQSPFGEQKCVLKFGSWTFDGFSLDVQFYGGKTEIDMSDFWDVGDWEITKTFAERVERYYKCCTEPYITMNYELTFQRRSKTGASCSK